MRTSIKRTLSLFLSLALIFLFGISSGASDNKSANSKAAALKQVGLFKGVSETSDNFDLERAPTRAEALVLLIRALGKEAEALNGDYKHPFTDVPDWADKYIGYAYQTGLTAGISATEFGTQNANAEMYLTFMLRALGYDDKAGDFSWDNPFALSKAVGILDDDVDTENFMRTDAVKVSWAALEADLKGGKQRMAKKLIADGVFTSDTYGGAIETVNEPESVTITVSTLEEFESALTKADYNEIIIDTAGTPLVVTGEISIPSGLVVTLKRGSDLYIEGKLTNDGVINVQGADFATEDYSNYSVMSIQNGGSFINNGKLNICQAFFEGDEDYGPVGGNVRIFDGVFENNGSVILKAADVNTHGGVLFVIDGEFNNNSVVIVDGFQIVVINKFNNNEGAVVINNTYICTRENGVFDGAGKLTGYKIVTE